MAAKTIDYTDLPSLEGGELPVSDWLEITQQRIDTFAEATGDFQYIHVDPEKAASGPFGGTIAHGFLTLALLAPLWFDTLEITGVTTRVNYGLDKVRFTAPVKSGSRVRLHATVKSVTEVKGGYQVAIDATFEIEGQERPAVIIEFIERDYA